MFKFSIQVDRILKIMSIGLGILLILAMISCNTQAQIKTRKRNVEVTCPSYSNATLVTYRWKKGTPRKSVNKVAKEEYFVLGKKSDRMKQFVIHQAPKRKRFTNDRKKTNKRINKCGLVKPRFLRPKACRKNPKKNY